ncbi:NmrA family NAD(P)-binding protein [Niabella sp. 22666]|uniref:NmrA family NAD(P)-binding protein n=1 Tax=Niabella sp. 22666 TaxID=3453954 RepID=UPI003F850CCF
MKIIITGSLGHISKPLTQELVAKGHTLRVISSNPQKQEAIRNLGAEATIGSLSDTDFLTRTFTGADAVYCMIPPNYAHPDQMVYYQETGKSYRQAILRTGVQRVVCLSSYGAHLPSGTGFIRGSYFVEQILNTIPDILLTHVRPTFFYYNLLGFIDMIKTAGFIGSVYGGDDRLTMVSPQDIATAIAEELEKTMNTEAIRYVASDDLTCSEAAAILGKAIGRPDLEWKILSEEVVLEALLGRGMTEESAAKYVELGMSIHTGKLRADYDMHPPILGKVRLKAYATEFARAFNS